MKNMLILGWIGVLAVVAGCGGDAASEPPVLDAQTQEVIQLEDQGIEAAERDR